MNSFEDLRERYSEMSDDDLVALLLQGTLTHEANKILLMELQVRNISQDRSTLIKEYGEVNSTAPSVGETASVAAKKLFPGS